MKISKAFRRISSLLLAFCLVAVTVGFYIIASSADAGDYLGEAGGIEYVSLGLSNAVVVGYIGGGQGSTLVIPETVTFEGEDYTVTQIHDRVFYGSLFTGVSLPNTLESIGDQAFTGSRISGVTIPGSVGSIGEEAFSRCLNLTGVLIETGVPAIGNGAFYECEGLVTVSIPDTVLEIGDSAFSGCVRLDNLTIPGSVTRIGDNAFEGCSGLSSLVLEDGVVDIGVQAFARTGISGISIPDTARLVGDRAFEGCPNLVNMESGNGVTDIGAAAFRNCPRLSSAMLGASVGTIGAEAFSGTVITSVNLPASLTAVGDKAFYNSQLSSLRIPASLVNIGAAAFAYNPNLSLITVDGSNPAYKAESSFLYNKSGGILLLAPMGISSAVIPDTVLVVSDSAFGGHSDLTSVSIGSAVREIGPEAFNDTRLASVSIPDSVETIGEYAFANCPHLTAVRIGAGVKTIGNNAFTGASFTRVDIPASVNTVEYQAFLGCSKLASIYFYGSLPAVFGDIDQDIFLQCNPSLTLYCPAGNASWDNFSYPGVARVERFLIEQAYSVTVTSTGGGAATATTYSAQSGTVVGLEAVPYYGCNFYRWRVVSGDVTGLVIDRAQTSFTMPGGDVELEAVFISNPYTSDSGSGGGGGGGGGDTGTAVISSFSTLTTAKAIDAVKLAVQSAKAVGTSPAVVSLRNIGPVSKATLEAMANAAGMPLLLQCDSIDARNKWVDVRITLDPSKADSDLNLSASTTGKKVDSAKAIFSNWFANNICVVSLEQQGGFGQAVEIAARLNISGLGDSKPELYLFDKAGNTYTRIPDTAFRIDQNGYVHFKTTVSGIIIVSEGLLVRK